MDRVLDNALNTRNYKDNLLLHYIKKDKRNGKLLYLGNNTEVIFIFSIYKHAIFQECGSSTNGF